jgi:rhodanese-related sulfurtransferase
VSWCLRCYEPVRQLTPRERPLPPLAEVEEPPEWVPRSPLRGLEPPVYSRWRAGPTTFGPVGRIVLTLLLAVAFPWGALTTFDPLRLWGMLGYGVVAALVLRSAWRKERVPDRRPGPLTSLRERVARRAPALARPVDARVLVICAAAVAVAAAVFAWLRLDGFAPYATLAALGAVGLGLFIAWFNEL